MSKEDLQQICVRIEPILKADITWSIENGFGWDPNYGANIKFGQRLFSPVNEDCGVCAFGAHVIRHCNNTDLVPASEFRDYFTERPKDWEVAAKSLGMDQSDSHSLYLAVSEEDDAMEDYDLSIWELSRRLRAHGYAEAERLLGDV